MKQFIFLVLLLVSATAFSQQSSDSVFSQKPSESIVIMKVDTFQIERINNIEENLRGFYTHNRVYHALMGVSVGLSLAGLFIATGQGNYSQAGTLQLAGMVIGMVGTVIYIDSYKFLNIKSRHKNQRVTSENNLTKTPFY